mmetsp:Transcript_11447/g.17313  ORF Transcript_11447/g.17313 Transcript_11447/m.17313 type:complete len:323 (-) Transcript_11447:25-993(-)
MNRLLFVAGALSATALVSFSPLCSSSPLHEVHCEEGQRGRYDVGGAKLQGLRPHMEDEYVIHETPSFSLFGVFDGHGGYRTSHCAHNFFASFFANRFKNGETPSSAILNSFSDTEEKYQALHPNNNGLEGSTAVVAVLLHPSEEEENEGSRGSLLVANAGDSRFVLVQRDGKQRGKIFETKDHKPNDPEEKERVYRLGGHVKTYFYDVPRIFGPDGGGGLALSRALGDFYYGEMVPCTPDISLRPISPQDEYLILASDGVFDVLSSAAAADLVWRAFLKDGVTAEDVSKALIDKALALGSTDNVAAIVVRLSTNEKIPKPKL